VHDYRPGLQFRGMRFVTDTVIELDFEGLGTADRTFQAELVGVGDGKFSVMQMDDEFSRLYRGVPCLSVGHSLNPMLMQAFNVRRDQLPADSEWERVNAECRERVTRAWNATERAQESP